MQVKDLIKQLQLLDPEMQVILQRDAEGNGYSPLAGVDENCVYTAETSYNGYVYDTTWTAEDAALFNEEWKELLTQPHCVVLYPKL